MPCANWKAVRLPYRINGTFCVDPDYLESDRQAVSFCTRAPQQHFFPGVISTTKKDGSY